MATKLRSYLDGLAIWNRPAAGERRTGAAKKINLALQGGGAHGAFTWGVLDHLLADGRLEISGISGASAGAVNAVMVADGLVRGGPEEARQRLAAFWRAASTGGGLPPRCDSPMAGFENSVLLVLWGASLRHLPHALGAAGPAIKK